MDYTHCDREAHPFEPWYRLTSAKGLKLFLGKRIQRLSKLALSVLLALIISMTGVVIPGVPLTTTGAEALPVNKALPSSLVKNIIRSWQKPERFIASGSSFFSDNSIFRATLGDTFALTFDPSVAPTFARTLSLIGRIDFFFEIQEFNLVNVTIGDKTTQPSPALEFYKLGVKKAQEKGDYRGAVKDYSDALSKDGNFAEAYVSRGRAYSELGDRQRAIEYQQKAIENYTKALEVKPKFAEDQNRYVEPLLGRGAVYLKLGKDQAALDDFSLAIQRNPDFYDAYLSRSTIYRGIGDYQKALEDLNLALYLNLDYPAAVLRRGSIRAELGEYEKAIEDFNEAIKSKAQDASTYYSNPI